MHKIVEILFGEQDLNQTQPCHSLDPLKTGKDVIVIIHRFASHSAHLQVLSNPGESVGVARLTSSRGDEACHANLGKVQLG